MNKRKIGVVMLAIIIIISFKGCFNYREINKITFATSVIFDKNEEGEVVVYLDCVRPYRNAGESSDKGKRVIYKGIGKTALEAIRDMDIESNNKLNFGQVRAYIFTEQVAREGIKKYIDIINNDQEFSYKPYMFTYFGEVEDLVELTSKDEEYLGLYLNELVEKNKNNGKVIYANVNDYLAETYTKGNVSFMSALKINEDNIERRVQLDGGVIMKDNSLVMKIEPKDALEYNLAQDKLGEGTFEISNPEEEDKYITLDILESKSITKIKLKDDNKITLLKKIDTTVSIGEIQGHLVIKNEDLEQIKLVEEEKIKNNIKHLFNFYKEKDVDVFGIERFIEEKYPNANLECPLNNADVEVDINLIIDGSSLIKNSI